GNGKSEVEPQDLDINHELPAADDTSSSEDQITETAQTTISEQQSELQKLREYAIADAVKALLPIMDSFQRALQSGSQAGEFRSGVELIYRQLQDALGKLGVTPIPAKG